jgi:hypothetical protein
MSEQTPYEILGISESDSFDTIQAARDRCMAEVGEDSRQREQVEAAYDAILMHRLRLRQEGKITVPERIRFAEQATPAPKKAPLPTAPTKASLPPWIERLLDRPSRAEVLWPSVIYGLLGLTSLLPNLPASTLQLLLVAGLGGAIYLLQRKEQRFGRSVLIAFLALLAGLGLGTLISSLVLPLLNLPLGPEAITSAIALLVLWLSATFLR